MGVSHRPTVCLHGLRAFRLGSIEAPMPAAKVARRVDIGRFAALARQFPSPPATRQMREGRISRGADQAFVNGFEAGNA